MYTSENEFLGATILREVLGCYFFFLGNECAKHSISLATGRRKDELGPLATAFSGGVAGVSYWASIFPLDTIKSKVQVASRADAWWVAASTWRTGGIAAFYRGVSPCLLRAFPAGAAMFLAYDCSKRHLTNLFASQNL